VKAIFLKLDMRHLIVTDLDPGRIGVLIQALSIPHILIEGTATPMWWSWYRR